MIEPAIELSAEADIFIVIGTSLNVYPAASLVYYIKKGIPVYLIDPHAEMLSGVKNLTVLRETAGTGVPKLVKQLMERDA
jgi:NAD-dependent deacetylase